jgi:prolyl-tRNA editing enzyme YbaK/EbsC (Cys-tRNA(Pro) deacylase)
MEKGEIFGPEDLQAYMEQYHISGEIVHLDVPTPTVETAAEAVGSQPEQIVKSLLFQVGDMVVLAITCGTLPVEKRVLAHRFGVGRKKVELADAETVRTETGYPVGGVPPIGHRQSIPALIDPRVLTNDEVYAGGGGENSLVRLNPEDIFKFSNAEIIALHSLPEE